MGFPAQGPLGLYYDNQALISIEHGLVLHDRAKYVEVDRHFIKDHLKFGIICTSFVNIEVQFADVLTKGLTTVQFSSIIGKLGMWDLYSLA